METKICSTCQRELPATSEFFSKDRKWLSSRCKSCRNRYFKKYRTENKAKINQYFKKNQHSFMEKDKKRIEDLGLNMSYRGLHLLIKRNKPKPKYCSICNQEKKLELASINHSYTKNINDWMWLCRSCHILLDKKLKEVEKL